MAHTASLELRLDQSASGFAHRGRAERRTGFGDPTTVRHWLELLRNRQRGENALDSTRLDAVAFLSLVIPMLFASSCIATAVYRPIGPEPTDLHRIPGVYMFLLGPFGLFDGHAGWYANPLMFWAYLSRKPQVLPAMVALLLAWTGYKFVLSPEAGEFYNAGAGLYLWLLCAILVVAQALLNAMRGPWR